MWDADRFNTDDFLGKIDLFLNRLPRGSRTAKLCKIHSPTTDGTSDINLFKARRIKRWWPVHAPTDPSKLTVFEEYSHNIINIFLTTNIGVCASSLQTLN